MTGFSIHSGGHRRFSPGEDGGTFLASKRVAEPRQAATRDRAATLEVRDQGRLEIKTAEGDTVSISFDAQSKLSTASHEDAGGSEQSFSASSRVSVKISVDGNLSDAELADIQKLVLGLGQQGSGGSSIGDLSTLSAYQYSESKTVEAGSLFRFAA